MATAANGTAPAIPKSGTQTELGTAIDRDRVWGDFTGRIFTPFDVTARKLDEMLRSDGKARGIEQALTLPLRGIGWDLLPGAGDSGEAAWTSEALTRNANAGGMSTPFELVLSQAVSACLFRKAFFEKVLRIDEEGRVVYDKLAFRPAPTCRLDYDEATGAFRGFRQRVPDEHPHKDAEGFAHIPPERAFVFIYGQHRRPIEGVSDLETVFALYETKQKIKYLWMTFLENQTMPKGVAQNDSSDPAAIREFAIKAATLRGNGVLGIGPDQSFTPYETSNAAAQAFSDAISFCDSEMYASVLAGFLQLTSSAASGKGSFALSDSATDFFLQSRQAVLTELAAAIENFVIADLIRFNFGKGAAVPRFKFHSLRKGDLQTAVGLLQSLAGQQQSRIPQTFLDLLVVQVAALLNLDVDQVTEAIKAGPAQTTDPTQAFMQSIQNATALIQQQDAGAAQAA